MTSYTSDGESTDKECWMNLTASCPPVSEDARRVVICDILQSLQNYLMGQIAKELECKSLNNDVFQEAHDESDSDDFSGNDDTALYRLGGWALLSAKRFRMKHTKQNKGNINYLTEEIQLLNELQEAKKQNCL